MDQRPTTMMGISKFAEKYGYVNIIPRGYQLVSGSATALALLCRYRKFKFAKQRIGWKGSGKSRLPVWAEGVVVSKADAKVLEALILDHAECERLSRENPGFLPF